MKNKLTRRSFHRLAASAILGNSLLPSCFSSSLSSEQHPQTGTLIHPGMLHSQADLDRMKTAILARREPIFSGFEIFRQHPNSQATYAMRGPAETIGRNPTVHVDLFDSDANAAYQCALMWCITGETAYATVSKQILSAWTRTLQSITGADAVLCAALGGFKLINAAELIRHSNAGWSPSEIQTAATCFRQVFLPVLRNYAPFANGNWDTAAIKCRMAIGIFCDDIALVDESLRYYLNGCGDGGLAHYIFPGGQCQESGRDQQHTQLGLGHMGDACEMAWNQGWDLYAALGNRLLEGFEYTAKYNIGFDVPFTPDQDQTGKYSHSVISPRGALRPVYEQIYNHYACRKRLPAPYTQKAAERLRPEGAANGADHPGFGTLLYSRTEEDWAPSTTLAEPLALYATPAAAQITLRWVPSTRLQNYVVHRMEEQSGKFQRIATQVTGAEFVDRTVQPGHAYRYQLRATNTSKGLREIRAVAGLPSQWAACNFGKGLPLGNASVAERSFVLQAYGLEPFADSEQGLFLYKELEKNGAITGCVSPLLASQSATFGLMLRSTPAANNPMVALMIAPDAKSERPQWLLTLIARQAAGEPVRIRSKVPLEAPFTSWGRLASPIWLRLIRRGNSVLAGLSANGVEWKMIGEMEIAVPHPLAGAFACSGLGERPALITFEQLNIEKMPPPKANMQRSIT